MRSGPFAFPAPLLLVALVSSACGSSATPDNGLGQCVLPCEREDVCPSTHFCSADDGFCHPKNREPVLCEPLACLGDEECTTPAGLAGTCECGLCTYVDPACPVTNRRFTRSGGESFAGECVAAAREVESQAFFSCALDTRGEVWCWGQNCDGQVGNHREDRSCDFSTSPPVVTIETVPVRVLEAPGGPAFGPARAIATGAAHACAIRDDQTVWCWGQNGAGQLGDGAGGVDDAGRPRVSLAPVLVQVADGSPLRGATRLAAGFFFTCALDEGGDVWCWGENGHGALGDGTVAPGVFRDHAARIVDPPGEAVKYQDIAAGGAFACAVERSGDFGRRLFCWGRNNLGQLAINTPCSLANDCGNLGTPQVVLRGAGTPEGEVCTAADHCDCTDFGGGCDCGGACSNPENRRHEDAVALENVNLSAQGLNHACAATGFPDQVWCWGQSENAANGTGEIGVTHFVANQVGFASIPIGVRGLAVGGDFGCALFANGDLHCWGGNDFGQLGAGHTDGPLLAPERTARGFTQVTAGIQHVCGVDQDGEVWCWGRNSNGELGIGSAVNQSEPTRALLGLCPER